MGDPISIRLDPEVQKTLTEEAQRRQIGLSKLLRQIAADAAWEVKRKRIREGSARVAAYIASSPEAAAFNEDWTTPRSEGL